MFCREISLNDFKNEPHVKKFMNEHKQPNSRRKIVKRKSKTSFDPTLVGTGVYSQPQVHQQKF